MGSVWYYPLIIKIVPYGDSIEEGETLGVADPNHTRQERASKIGDLLIQLL